jgi:hypothetical protein
MAGRLKPHPPPPSDFDRSRLPLVRAKGPWFRIHPAGRSPAHFSKSGDHRFDDPLGKYGTLYVALDFAGAFIETAGHRTGIRLVTRTWLGGRALSTVTSRRPLKLVDLTGPGLPTLGADSRLFSGEYRLSQGWGRAIWAHPSRPDGILYLSRHDPSRRSLAIFDRGRIRTTLKHSSAGTLLSADVMPLLASALKKYEFGVHWG